MLLDKIRNYLFGETIKELKNEISVLRNNLKGKVSIYCDNSNCFEHNGNKTCGLSPSLFLDKEGKCKEYMNDYTLDKELNAEVNNCIVFQVNDSSKGDN